MGEDWFIRQGNRKVGRPLFGWVLESCSRKKWSWLVWLVGIGTKLPLQFNFLIKKANIKKITSSIKKPTMLAMWQEQIIIIDI